ncbi:hypothetical protein ACS0TY_021149 [Phlomoides rotata]
MFLSVLLLRFQTPHSLRTYNNPIALGSSLSPPPGESSWNSPSGLFSFGFYQQGRDLAVGIWLSGTIEGFPANTVVWTANRDDSQVSSRSTINFTADGNLLICDERCEPKGITESGLPSAASAAEMLDSGNFVLYGEDSKVIWQSFDHPTDTILGGQSLNVNGRLVSSASSSDHSSGRFYLTLQTDENLVASPVNRSGFFAYWASNTYVSRGSHGRPDVFFFLNQTGLLSICYPNDTFKTINIPRKYKTSRVIYRATLRSDGNFVLYSHRFNGSNDVKVEVEWSAIDFDTPCEIAAYCGLNSYCSENKGSGNCTCFPGFVQHSDSTSPDCYPEFLDDGGCAANHNSELSYNMTLLQNVSWRSSPYAVTANASSQDCNNVCLQDCDCWGALFDSDEEICTRYKLPLIYATLNTQNSITAFFKSTSQANYTVQSNSTVLVVHRTKAIALYVGLSLGLFAVICSILAIFSFFLYRRRAYRYSVLPATAHQVLNGDQFTLRSFSYAELERATDGFKDILGLNPSGAVYKGRWPDCNKSIAVKKLENVAEGDRKFRTEMTAVGRTHHRNLVPLLGFCIDGSRKLLVYEFMKNGSLAEFLFEVENRPHWNVRVRIALDVARGILYLHECETRIIHCNIKPQNILLNDSWTAKISDFGLAKLLMTNELGTYTGAKGTSSYMAPEWQKTSLITEKADVYSFGVVLLEIVCCRRNTEEALGLNWVYDCFEANELRNLVGDEDVDVKVLERMVRVGLLCVQDDANLRPAMKNAIMMLEGTMNIPEPQPCKY